MRTYTKIGMPLLLWALILLGVSGSAEATTYHSFLRINKIYVLYTAPIVPHADSNGIFWVGLHPFASLIGAMYQENYSSQSVTLTCRHHTLTLVAGARQVILDDKVYALPAAAKRVGAERQWVAPVLGIARAFGLRTHLDSPLHVLTLVDEDFFDKGYAGEWTSQILQFERLPRGYPQGFRAFTGPPYPLGTVVPVALTYNKPGLVWHLRNVSQKDMPGMDINLLVTGSNGEELYKEGIPFPSASFTVPIPNYPVKAGRTVDFGLSTADTVTNDFSPNPTNPATGTVTPVRHTVDSVVTWLVP